MSKDPVLTLGTYRRIDGAPGGVLRVPARHLVTHGAIVGMTGGGKTGLLTVLTEECLRAGVPTLVIDIKGDLPNLLCTFPGFDPSTVLPWVDSEEDGPVSLPPVEAAARLCEERRRSLAEWGIGEAELKQFSDSIAVRVLTPGATSGEPVHILSTLERRSERWSTDVESARAALSASASLVMRLIGRDPDPARSPEHVLLSALAERRLIAGQDANLGDLMEDIIDPPMQELGALHIDTFLPKPARKKLAAALNTLLASTSFASWREGTSLDIGQWLTPKNGRTPAVVVSVAHLDDEERALVLGVLLEEVLCWVRSLKGSQRLKALLVFDEVYGFLPPNPANPPTKRPMVALMKQGRAFGVGVLVATQNPMDLDYRALSNAGLWFLGRLQTDADRERVLDGIATVEVKGKDTPLDLGEVVRKLKPRWFVARNAHCQSGPILMQPRQTMSLMRGPMTRTELKKAREQREQTERTRS